MSRLLASLLGFVIASLLASCGDDDVPSDSGTGSDARVVCVDDGECDDGLFCNGAERCAPGPGAGARGCVVAASPCGAAECDEAADRCDVDCSNPDADGDGAIAVACGGDDCDDTDADIGPDQSEICDPEGVDEDCDPTTVGTRDADGDGAVDSACCNGASCGLDCDDAAADVLPGATEACNERDDDCDGSVDEGLILERYLPDTDRDGFGDAEGAAVMACARPDDYAANDLDCDDTDVDVAPGAAERCNGEDDDCDGTIDELEDNVFYRDADGDGWGVSSDSVTTDGCVPPSGYVGRVGDCDDGEATTNPGATERCNGIDDDCSLLAAPGGPDLAEDADGDLHAPLGATCDGGFPKDDCDDTRATIFLGADELCSGFDEDCDGTTDEGSDAQCPTGTCDSGCVVDRTLDMQSEAVCAVRGGAAYCWGEGPGLPEQSNLVLEAGVELLEGRPRRIATLSSLRSIGTSGGFGCAVQNDRTVVCWGLNHRGQLGAGDTAGRDAPVAVAGLADVVQLAVGDLSSCALSADGSVRCWGGNEDGQIGDGTTDDRSRPTLVRTLDRVVEIAAYGYTFCARRFEGSVWCWGDGGIGDGTGFDRLLPVRVIATGARRLVGGGNASGSAMCALLADGWSCWGFHPTLGVAGEGLAPEPLVAASGVRLPAHSDDSVACAILTDGTVGCWGNDDSRVGGPVIGGPPSDVALPVSGLTDVVDLQCGSDVCCAFDGATWTCFGLGNALAMGDGPRERGPFRTVDALFSPRAVAFGRAAGCAVDASGTLSCFGAATSRSLGFVPGGSSWVYPEPVEVPLPFEAVDVRTYEYRFCALGAGGQVACWGGDDAPGDGTTVGAATPRVVDATSMGAVSAIAVGLDFSCAIASADGSAWCWGPASGTRTGLCGDGGTGCVRPVQVDGARSYTAIHAGRSHVCARTSSGELWCWGFAGTVGALGDGTTAWATRPVRSGTFDDVIDVQTGRVHTCVLRAGGGVSCVGGGSEGQLGVDVSSSLTYVDVPGLSGITALRCHSNSCFARRGDGTWVGWGADRGLLGVDGALVEERPGPVGAAYGATGELWSGVWSACVDGGAALSCWGTAGSALFGGPLTSGVRQRALPTRGVPALP
jgi:alpha-tubulin suppressor-like RCC1 family protein